MCRSQDLSSIRRFVRNYHGHTKVIPVLADLTVRFKYSMWLCPASFKLNRCCPGYAKQVSASEHVRAKQ